MKGHSFFQGGGGLEWNDKNTMANKIAFSRTTDSIETKLCTFILHVSLEWNGKHTMANKIAFFRTTDPIQTKPCIIRMKWQKYNGE